jgi:hypothetical protein
VPGQRTFSRYLDKFEHAGLTVNHEVLPIYHIGIIKALSKIRHAVSGRIMRTSDERARRG